MTEIKPVESIISVSTDSQPNWLRCLCHVTESKDKLTPFTEKSWKKFLECSQRRKDQIWIVMRNHFNDGPKGGYHRKCYQRYTNVGHISRIEGAVSQAISSSHADIKDEIEEPPAKRLHRSDVNKFDTNQCVICQKEKGKVGNEGQRTKETLSLNISEHGSEALLRAAEIRNDDRVLLQIQGQDCIAREIKYHRSCYKNYVRSDRLAKLEAEDCEEEDKECSGYSKAFDKVRHYVEAEVIANYRVVTMSALTQKFVSHLIQEGVEVGGYRASKLKLRLKCAFGDQLELQKPRNARQSELVYYARVKKGEMVEHMFLNSGMPESESKMTEPKNKQEVDNITSQVYHTSKQLRSVLVDLKPVISWPPSPDELDSDAGLVPDLLYNMLAWILTSDAEYSSQRVRNLPSHVHRWILSLGQDLIHCVTRGRIKTPKHTLLPITVKSLTGNAEIVTLLNRFGHGLSYSHIEELETAIAEKQISNNNDGILLPSVCSPNIPAVFCWDNNDLQEETLSGKGTTHCTNGIAIQRRPLTCSLPPDMQPGPVQASSKRRSVTHLGTDVIPYHNGRRQGPTPMSVDVNLITQMSTEISHRVRMIDYGWMLCRQPWEDTIFSLAAEQQQVIPAWTGFNIKLQEKNELRQSNIGYCPMIESSPTEPSTVYTILKRSLQMADQLNQTDVIVVLDQAIYAKAMDIVWQETVQFERVVLRLGTFHTVCALTAAIGKRFAGAGLEDILIESGIVATGSVAGVLQGKHYNRAIRTHKIVYEALHRLQWQEFKTWLQRHGKNTNYALLVNAVQLVRKDFNAVHFEEVLSLNEFQDLAYLYKQFCEDDKDGPIKSFWNSYLEMVAILLDTIRATREGDWDLHLQSIKAMIPWFFAYDHTNYARYLPVYLLHMLALPDTHPEAHKMLSQGDFGVQRTSSHGFSQLPVDQTIEQTLNRNTKTNGGIVGFSLKKGAVQRWLLTAHARASFIDRCREMADSGCQEKSTFHKESGSARLKKDEEDVQKVMSVISQWRNPFEKSEELVSLSSGSIADHQLQDDLLKAKEKGTSAMLSFVSDRLLSSKTGFFDPLPRMKLGRFGKAKKAVRAGGKSFVLQADRNLFARLLVVGQSRQIDVRDLLTHELGPVPWSLASFDGSLAKTNKSLIVKLLEDGVVAPENPPRPTCVIIDAMALMQTLNRLPDRFIDLAELVLGIAVKQAGDATRIDIVADQYPAISIKNGEREKRGSAGQLATQITSGQQFCPRQWKKFLSTGSNKTNLMMFLAEEWATNQQLTSRMIRDRTLYVTHRETCTKISVSPQGLILATVVEELSSNQEEADTRMFLHASHASNAGHQQILIKSSYTDVECLACHLQENISAEITLLSGTRSRARLVSVPSVCDTLGIEVCRALPGIHALTGCDTVSAFAGKGKKAALDIVRRDKSSRESICTLGNNVPIREEDLRALEKFVCVLYGDPTSSSVNDTRYRLFCMKKNVQSHQLPPSHAALWKHLQRANYQTYLWKHALVARITNHEPHGQGWRQHGEQLEIDWTDQAPAPESVMELMSCGCKGKCDTRRCSCMKNGLHCTDACSCQEECVNCSSESDSDSDDEWDSDSSSEDEEET